MATFTIVDLDSVAAVTLLQTVKAVGHLRQRLHDYEGILTVVTYHPAYLLRKPADKKKSWDDLRYIRRLIRKLKEFVLTLDGVDARTIKFYQSPFEIYRMVKSQSLQSKVE